MKRGRDLHGKQKGRGLDRAAEGKMPERVRQGFLRGKRAVPAANGEADIGKNCHPES